MLSALCWHAPPLTNFFWDNFGSDFQEKGAELSRMGLELILGQKKYTQEPESKGGKKHFWTLQMAPLILNYNYNQISSRSFFFNNNFSGCIFQR